MAGNPMQAEMPSDDWFQQVNGLLGGVTVAEQPRQNSLNLLTGIESYNDFFLSYIIYNVICCF